MKVKLQDRFISGLKNCGCQAVNSNSERHVIYTAFEFYNDRRMEDDYFFVGKTGSVRVGRSYADSIPVSEQVKSVILSYAVSEAA